MDLGSHSASATLSLGEILGHGESDSLRLIDSI